MEQTAQQNYLSNELTVDAVAYEHLKETAMWGKFLGITGMLFSILLIGFGFFAGAIFSKLTTFPGAEPNPLAGFGVGFISALYVILGLFSMALSWLMYKFGSKTQQGLRTSDQTSMNAGLANLKILFRIYGIIIIIYLGFVALALVASIISGLTK